MGRALNEADEGLEFGFACEGVSTVCALAKVANAVRITPDKRVVAFMDIPALWSLVIAGDRNLVDASNAINLVENSDIPVFLFTTAG